MFWIYWVGVNTESTIWQLVVILQNLFLNPLSKFKIYNMKNMLSNCSGLDSHVLCWNVQINSEKIKKSAKR